MGEVAESHFLARANVDEFPGLLYAVAFEEKEKGSIAPGKIADVVVLAEDLFSIPPEKIKEVRVALTIFFGNFVFFC